MIVGIRRLVVLLVLTVFVGIGVGVMVFAYSEVGVTSETWSGVLTVSSYDFTNVPQNVVDDANELAAELFGDSQEKYTDFVNQLLTTYTEAEDKDFIVLFNPGGWGWNLIDRSPGWGSILTGIKDNLDSMGYTSLLLNYQRTSATLLGRTEEFVEGVMQYPSKAQDLAHRVEFLTTHIPNLRVIVAGESNGTVISDSTMNILQNNPYVYSIQTGTPFWHETVMLERTLILNNNGIGPDSFSEGNIPYMLWASLKYLLGVSSPRDNPGEILHFLKAPGHDYSWQYPEVYAKITMFLENNFESR